MVVGFEFLSQHHVASKFFATEPKISNILPYVASPGNPLKKQEILTA